MDSIWTQSMDFIWSMSPHGMGLESIWNDVGVHMDSMEWLVESMESICIPYGKTRGG